MSVTHSIRIEGLSKSYAAGSRNVLDRVSLEIDPGQAVAIRGRSGSGKSTLLNLLAGIDAPDEGSSVVGDDDITALTDAERTNFRRRHVGFIYQSFHLIPVLCNFDNLRLVVELNNKPNSAHRALIMDALDAVGLADRADAFPDELSGGEQQRVAVARALIHRPTVVLADEPTGNLDSHNAQRVMELLINLVQQQKSTLVMATHSRSTAAYCDRSLEIRDGKIGA